MTEYPVKVTLTSGTVLNVFSTRETMEGYYGNVNNMVAEMIKPLKDITRIEVTVYSEFLEDFITEVTYDHILEAWADRSERVVITYDFDGLPEDERGFIDRIDGWLPSYGLRKRSNFRRVHSIPTEDVINIRTAKRVNMDARNERHLDYYYKDPATYNKKCVTRQRNARLATKTVQ